MSLHLRPTFAIEIAEPFGVVLRRMRQQLQAPDVLVRWARTPGGGLAQLRDDQDHVVLCMVESQRHFWSPWLMLDVQPSRVGTQLCGRFSPHPSVWTGFAFAYLVLAVVGCFSLIFAGAMHLSGGRPWAAIGAPLCAAVALGLWWASQLGQRLAAGQMLVLRSCVDGGVRAATATQETVD